MNPQVGQVGQVGTPPQMAGPNAATPQNIQQNLLISQTNTMSMGGGQITQNVSSTGQPGQGMAGIINQNVSPAGMRPNIRMPGIQPGNAQTGMTYLLFCILPFLNVLFIGMQPNMMQNPVHQNQLEVERRQNLEKINQLKQTLEAHQQQEQQYKSQLERISHMKTSQLQEALQIAQQTEMQFKLLENVSTLIVFNTFHNSINGFMKSRNLEDKICVLTFLL